jgi:hypothetical protein
MEVSVPNAERLNKHTARLAVKNKRFIKTVFKVKYLQFLTTIDKNGLPVLKKNRHDLDKRLIGV